MVSKRSEPLRLGTSRKSSRGSSESLEVVLDAPGSSEGILLVV